MAFKKRHVTLLLYASQDASHRPQATRLMARNRAGEDRETKRAEILDEATNLFVAHGFEGTSMQALAKAAGITTTTIYWYFADKDALLVAVVDRVTSSGLRAIAAAAHPQLIDRLLAVTELFDREDRLIAAVHARAAVSPEVAAWHDQFHTRTDAAVVAEIRAHREASGRDPVNPADLRSLPRIWSYAIEGMVEHRLPADERRQLCEMLIRQLDAL
jgi:AcrR family transcriptional regulator